MQLTQDELSEDALPVEKPLVESTDRQPQIKTPEQVTDNAQRLKGLERIIAQRGEQRETRRARTDGRKTWEKTGSYSPEQEVTAK
jgi:hypothetical protein